jgi:hypothetical protein
MDSLVKKLIKLNDLIKALKMPKQAQTPSLPVLQDIKPPTPPALPSIKPSANKAPKITSGVGPESKKDPKKVAEQIKNGSMSTKTQKVMLKIEQNGQWSLEKGAMQRVAPISPQDKSKYSGQVKQLKNWLSSDPEDKSAQKVRESSERLEGPGRIRALHKLHSLTKVRKNPTTGEREFLLHRSMSNEELDSHKKGKVSNKTSWSPYKATGFEDNGDNYGYDTKVSAWIPESHIHHIPIAVADRTKRTPMHEMMEKEHEVIVNPHQMQLTPFEDKF